MMTDWPALVIESEDENEDEDDLVPFEEAVFQYVRDL